MLAKQPYDSTYDFNIAQTFRLSTPAGVSGAYVTKLDLFFKKKSSSLGVEVYLVEVGDNGVPVKDSIVSGSRVTKNAQDVAVSDIGTVATSFTFNAPVFLQSNKPYAFIIKPMGNAPDYELWLGESGELDVSTQKPVWATPQAEQAFFASSQQSLASLQKEDVKFKLYRAKFRAYQDGYAVFNREPDDYLYVANLALANVSNSIQVGDRCQQNSTVYGTVQMFDQTSGYLVLNTSTGGFAAGNRLTFYREPVPGWTLGDPIANCDLTGLALIPGHAFVPQFRVVENAQTRVTFAVKSATRSGNTMTLDTSYVSAPNDNEIEFSDTARTVVGRSIERLQLANNSSLSVRATLRTDSDFTSPMIDLRRRGGLVISNLINNDVTNEHTQYGAAKTKYISKNIVLSDGMEAEDLKAFVTAYRPAGTDVKVYAKVWNPEDPQTFDEKLWTPMTPAAATQSFSDPQDRDDYIEYEFDMPLVTGLLFGQAYRNQSTGVVEYNTSLGTFSSFKVFALKVVMTSDDPTKYPLLNDVRAIALQV